MKNASPISPKALYVRPDYRSSKVTLDFLDEIGDTFFINKGESPLSTLFECTKQCKVKELKKARGVWAKVTTQTLVRARCSATVGMRWIEANGCP
jgi:hypothetical protein